MKSRKKFEFKKIFPMIGLLSMFIISQLLALTVTEPFNEAGMQAFENPSNPSNLLYYLGIILVFTLLILFIAKKGKEKLIKVIIYGAIGMTIFYVFLPLFWMITPFAFIPSIVTAILLLILIFVYPEWYIIDGCGIIISAGAIAIFGISLSVPLVILLLIALAIYDGIAVYKTKHMIDLADTILDFHLPMMIISPKSLNYSFRSEKSMLKSKSKEKDALFMGLGDIVMPGILASSSYHFLNSLPVALSVIGGALIGFSILMVFVAKGKPQAGLPFLNGGAIAGYLFSCYLMGIPLT